MLPPNTMPTHYNHLRPKKPTGPFREDAQVVTPPHVKVQRIPYRGPAPSYEGPAFVTGGNQRGRVLQEVKA